MFLTNATLTQAVHDTLQKDAAAVLSPYWNTVITQALNWSYWEIVQRLMQRGYSKTLIDQWDRGAEFQQDMGVWKALQWIATQTSLKVEQSSLNFMDRRLELSGGEAILGGRLVKFDPVMVTIAGVLQQPDTSVGQATTGTIEGGGRAGYPYELPVANGPNWDGVIQDANFAGPRFDQTEPLE